MSNENKTYTTISEITPIVDKTTESDTAALNAIFHSFVQMIRDKHLI